MINSGSYNPDVLTCIANLSSDEVFTPPQLANRLLDLIILDMWCQDALPIDLVIGKEPICSLGVAPVTSGLRDAGGRLCAEVLDQADCTFIESGVSQSKCCEFSVGPAHWCPC